MSVETVTLGCRLNFAESETIARLAPSDEDWVVVNSCAVTAEAVRQTRQAIRRARRERPGARILVTGCAAELDPGSFKAMPEVDRVVGNSDKLRQPFAPPRHPGLDPGSALFLPVEERQTPAQGRGDGVPDVTTPTPVPAAFLHQVKSFVAVQTGCDHRCTFCSIWQARGPSISLAFEGIRDAIARELDRGSKEIVLTGVDITSYDRRGMRLGELCRRLLDAEPRLTRLRLSSLDGIEMDETLFELIAHEPRLMPHFHLSLQAGDDMILKRMKRRHSRSDAVRIVERIKAARSDATIGADLIAGFPTETEEMALNTLKLLDDCEVVAAHVFPFSPRPDTPAARMPQLPRELVKARAARLREAAAERRSRWLDGLAGSTHTVLIDAEGKGHSNGFAPVVVDSARRGDIGPVRITGRTGDALIGVWA